jgi:NAD(P)-dependent dehydrogenase (short-subunit alcohol dehydrogenase family)
MTFDLKGVIVTGAAGGLGRAVALGLADGGVPSLCIDIDAGGLRETAALVGARGGSAGTFVADMSSAEAIDGVFRQIADSGMAFDGIVTCAGIASKSKILDMTLDEWDRVININLRATFLCVQHALRIMVAQRRGRIVTVSSDTGKRGGGRLSTSAYGASKGGVVTFTRSLARELASFGGAIRVNGLCPGPMWTEMHRDLTAEQREMVERSTLLGRFGTPAEIAAGALFLLSDEASFVYGETLVVDGGVVVD